MAKPLRDIALKAHKEGKLSGVKKSTTEPADISKLNTSPGNNDFAKKHTIQKHADRAGNSDKVRGSGPVEFEGKKSSKHHDQKDSVYESMKCESCGKAYESESCGCGGKSVPEAGSGKRGMIADKKKLEEVLTKKTPVSKVIDDFVHSDNKTFSGDSKKQRIKRALGAYYGMQKEEEQIDELSKETVGNYAKDATRNALTQQYALGKKESVNTRKLMNRRKGIDQAVNKLTGTAKVPANEELAMPMLEGGKKKKTQKESAPGDTPMRFPSGNVGDSDTGRV